MDGHVHFISYRAAERFWSRFGIDDLVGSAKFGVQLQTNVVNRLATPIPDEGIFFQDDLSRDTVDCVTQSLDGRIDVTFFSEHEDHDQVDFSFLFKVFVKRNEIPVLIKISKFRNTSLIKRD